ncbi:unnamed protein product [Meloidogyne enterolobii]|uniref:Uncharacterized protein n=1 Tax=Meloidogyne enterolobii TaxID=390850 RepID=A0ACB0Z560_MELEN
MSLLPSFFNTQGSNTVPISPFSLFLCAIDSACLALLNDSSFVEIRWANKSFYWRPTETRSRFSYNIPRPVSRYDITSFFVTGHYSFLDIFPVLVYR